MAERRRLVAAYIGEEWVGINKRQAVRLIRETEQMLRDMLARNYETAISYQVYSDGELALIDSGLLEAHQTAVFERVFLDGRAKYMKDVLKGK